MAFKVAKAATGLAENRNNSSSERDQDILELKLPGEVYIPSIPLVTTKTEAHQSNPLAAAHAWRAAQLADDAQWIMNTFASQDQPELQR